MKQGQIVLILGYFLAIAGLVFWIYSIIPSVTNYPFPIAWSESGRIFAAFQFYAPIITGKFFSLPWLDPGRSILDGLVFLIPNLQIWAYRLWMNILFLVFNCLAAVFTIRKVIIYSQSPDKRKISIVVLLILFGTLFLLQGPIYYHVLAGIIPVLWLYDEERPVRNLIVIIFCSMWEGMCRVNWFLMPAGIAILIHVLRSPWEGNNIWRFIKWPVIYAFSGVISSFSIYLLYINAMGYVIPFLNPLMDYAYFLYKLWPNAGYMGLIPGITKITLPILLVALNFAWRFRKNIRWLRWSIILGILGSFFIVSTIISLRAGGGYDVHNYDTFLLFLFIIGCFIGMNAVYLDIPGQLGKPIFSNYGVLVLLVVIPTLVAIPKSSETIPKANAQTGQTLQEIGKTLQSASVSINHPILFIDQRQLLVFNLLKEKDIYVPYEKIELMEMAMARNQVYKEKFVGDLQNHKFSFIVSEILSIWPKNFDPNFIDPYWYENNVWVDLVGIPVSNYYLPIYINQNYGIAIYEPK
jgi:hypothetical protein